MRVSKSLKSIIIGLNSRRKILENEKLFNSSDIGYRFLKYFVNHLLLATKQLICSSSWVKPAAIFWYPVVVEKLILAPSIFNFGSLRFKKIKFLFYKYTFSCLPNTIQHIKIVFISLTPNVL